MRIIALMIAGLVLAGCATMSRRPMQFADAVRNAVEETSFRTNVVIVVENDGTLSVAGRPTTLAELATIRSVSGLPENPPSVIIRAYYEARHADIKSVMDALAKAGIWRVTFAAIKNKPQNNTSEGIRQPAGGSPKPSM